MKEKEFKPKQDFLLRTPIGRVMSTGLLLLTLTTTGQMIHMGCSKRPENPAKTAETLMGFEEFTNLGYELKTALIPKQEGTIKHISRVDALDAVANPDSTELTYMGNVKVRSVKEKSFLNRKLEFREYTTLGTLIFERTE